MSNKKTRAAASLLALSLTCGMAAPGPALASYSDVNGHWAQSAIESWQASGLIDGYENGTFRPNNAITRAELVHLINSAFGFTQKGQVSFNDVGAGDWYFNDVSIAMGKQYCSGYEDNSFRPSATVTRAEAAAFVARAKALADNAGALSAFTDVAAIPAWAKGSVGAMASAGFMSGNPDGSFQPGSALTRAEAVSILDRVRKSTSSFDTTDPFQNGSNGSTTDKKGDHSETSEALRSNVTLTDANVDNYEGATLTGNTTIQLRTGTMTLKNITFDGNVTIESASSALPTAPVYGALPGTPVYGATSYTLKLTGSTKFNKTVTANRAVTISGATSKNTIETLTADKKTTLTGSLFVNYLNANAAVEAESDTRIHAITIAPGATLDISGELDSIETTGSGTISSIRYAGKTAVKVTVGRSITLTKLTSTSSKKITIDGKGTISTLSAKSYSVGSDVTVSNKTNPDDDKVTGVSLNKTGTSIAVGASEVLTATVKPTTATNKTVSWKSSDDSVATVSGGKVTGVKEGTATITVTTNDGSYTATCTVTVTKASADVRVTGVQIDKTATVQKGVAITLSPTITPANATNKTVSWKSSDDSVATVSGGEVTGVKEGTAVITVTTNDGSYTATCTVEVTGSTPPSDIKVQTITVQADKTELTEGDTTNCKANVLPVNAANAEVAWSSGNESTATVDKNGKVTAISGGTVTITATAKDGSGVTGSIEITVQSKPVLVENISLNPSSLELKVKEEATLTADILPIGAANASLKWYSEDENIATVDQNGVVRAVGTGTVKITVEAQDGSGMSASCSVKVSEGGDSTETTP